MTVYAFEDRTPSIGGDTYIHPTASVIGDVSIGKGCWIGPGACIRGDYGTIVIGDFSSVEENVVIHARPGRGDRPELRAAPPSKFPATDGPRSTSRHHCRPALLFRTRLPARCRTQPASRPPHRIVTCAKRKDLRITRTGAPGHR